MLLDLCKMRGRFVQAATHQAHEGVVDAVLRQVMHDHWPDKGVQYRFKRRAFPTALRLDPVEQRDPGRVHRHEVAGKNRLDQPCFGPEMVVDSRQVHTGGRRDVPHGRAIQPFVGEYTFRRVQDAVSGCLFIDGVAGLGHHHFASAEGKGNPGSAIKLNVRFNPVNTSSPLTTLHDIARRTKQRSRETVVQIVARDVAGSRFST